MPELPEVETVCRTLAAAVVGRQVESVRVARRDVVRGPTTLLSGDRIQKILRHGKQLALVGDGGGCVCVHLGMSGSLRTVSREASRNGQPQTGLANDHVHVVWTLDDGGEIRFRDPRRFGGVWAFADEADLIDQRWGRLGPDGLVIKPKQLHQGLSRTQRALKAALLDQDLVAGLGNIYVDELLYATRLHPEKTASTVTRVQAQHLVRAMRRILNRAIDAGGSTLRDYVDAEGRSGGFQTRHRVYGRGGEPCPGCTQTLDRLVIAGRTTTACGKCQVR